MHSFLIFHCSPSASNNRILSEDTKDRNGERERKAKLNCTKGSRDNIIIIPLTITIQIPYTHRAL